MDIGLCTFMYIDFPRLDSLSCESSFQHSLSLNFEQIHIFIMSLLSITTTKYHQRGGQYLLSVRQRVHCHSTRKPSTMATVQSCYQQLHLGFTPDDSKLGTKTCFVLSKHQFN